MRSTLVYDLPTRLFHWLFSILFLLSFCIAKTVDEDSIIFSFHMLSGILLTGLVLWRILWGFIGTKHSKFSGFNLNPLNLKNYLIGILNGSKKRWVGHNPASSWAAFTLFALALGLGFTGMQMSSGNKEAFEDIHELLANTFIVVILMHIAGVILHSLKHHDNIALSMIDGKKEILENVESIPSSKKLTAALLLILVIATGAYLFNRFDLQNRTLSVFDSTFQLGENQNDTTERSTNEESEFKNSNSLNQNENDDED